MLIKETSDMTTVERQTVHNQNNLYLETGIQKVLADGYNIDKLKLNGKFAILNATGTLPSGYSSDDNNFFIECYMWFEHYGRQVLHDVRTNKTFSRNLYNDVWQSWQFIDYIVERGTTKVDGVTWTYEKWASGKAICWGINSYAVNITTAAGTGGWCYSAVIEGAKFPFSFMEIEPICQITTQGGIACVVFNETGSYASPTKTQKFFLARYNSVGSTTVVVNYYAVGTWK